MTNNLGYATFGSNTYTELTLILTVNTKCAHVHSTQKSLTSYPEFRRDIRKQVSQCATYPVIYIWTLIRPPAGAFSVHKPPIPGLQLYAKERIRVIGNPDNGDSQGMAPQIRSFDYIF